MAKPVGKPEWALSYVLLLLAPAAFTYAVLRCDAIMQAMTGVMLVMAVLVLPRIFLAEDR